MFFWFVSYCNKRYSEMIARMFSCSARLLTLSEGIMMTYGVMYWVAMDWMRGIRLQKNFLGFCGIYSICAIPPRTWIQEVIKLKNAECRKIFLDPVVTWSSTTSSLGMRRINQLFIMNTWFQKKKQHHGSWTHPGTRNGSMIDFVGLRSSDWSFSFDWSSWDD